MNLNTGYNKLTLNNLYALLASGGHSEFIKEVVVGTGGSVTFTKSNDETVTITIPSANWIPHYNTPENDIDSIPNNNEDVNYWQTNNTASSWTGTKPSNTNNALAILNLHTHKLKWYSQVAFDTKNNRLWMRSAANASSFGDWSKVAYVSDIPEVPSWALASSKPSYSFSEITGSLTSISSRGVENCETDRTSAKGNLYTYNTNSTYHENAPTTYTSIIGFGMNTAGHGEIAICWTGGTSNYSNGMYYRALRDTADNWFGWTKLLDVHNWSSYISIPSVPSWALESTKPSYSWSEINNKPLPSSAGNSTTPVYWNGSSFVNASSYPTTLPASDVYSWAKASTKPTYSWSEITDKPSAVGSTSSPVYWDGSTFQTSTSINSAKILSSTSDYLGKGLLFTAGLFDSTQAFEGSSNDINLFSFPKGGTLHSLEEEGGIANIQNIRLIFNPNTWRDLFLSPNNEQVFVRRVNVTAKNWYALAKIAVNTTSGNIDVGNSSTPIYASKGTLYACTSVMAASTSARGGIKVSNVLSSAVTLTSGNGSTANRYYGVQTDSNGVAFVNIPWTSLTQTLDTSSTDCKLLFTSASSNGATLTSVKYNNAIYANLSTGNLYANSYYATSDITMKTNINKISDSIYSFNYKYTNKKGYGFIALYLETTNPELISGEKIKRVDYNSALALVIAKLENRIKELEEWKRKLLQQEN